MASAPLPAKTCASCGRAMEWRRAWAANWDEVRYCGERCRRQRPGRDGAALEEAIELLLDRRAVDATICPSEAARQVGGGDWRRLMEPTRAAARRLVAAGKVDIVQRGRAVDGSTARGPVRIRRRRGGAPT